MASGGSGRSSRSGRGGGRRRPRGSRSPAQGQAKKGRAAVTQSPRKGKAFSTPYDVPETGPIQPFDLFCACLLGLMPDGTYRSAGLVEVAKRFRRSPGEIRQMLRDYGMDAESMRAVDFDVSLAKLDIQVAPEGIDRRELARGLFDEFVDVHPTLQEAVARGNGGGADDNGAGGGKPVPEAEPAAPRGEALEKGTKPRRRKEKAPEAVRGEAEVEVSAEAEPEVETVVPEESLVTADVSGSGDAAGSSTGAGPVDRPVRQIRRSPVRRGRGS